MFAASWAAGVFATVMIVLATRSCFEEKRPLTVDRAVDHVVEIVASDPWALAPGILSSPGGEDFVRRLTVSCLRAVAAHPELDWEGCAREAAATEIDVVEPTDFRERAWRALRSSPDFKRAVWSALSVDEESEE